jgi:hypothetical protein
LSRTEAATEWPFGINCRGNGMPDYLDQISPFLPYQELVAKKWETCMKRLMVLRDLVSGVAIQREDAAKFCNMKFSDVIC